MLRQRTNNILASENTLKLFISHRLRIQRSIFRERIRLLRTNHTILPRFITHCLNRALSFVNKNTIPYDPKPPLVASGIRIGTPAVTSRGMEKPQMIEIADLIAKALESPEDDEHLESVHQQVLALCENFPLYPPLP